MEEFWKFQKNCHTTHLAHLTFCFTTLHFQSAVAVVLGGDWFRIHMGWMSIDHENLAGNLTTSGAITYQLKVRYIPGADPIVSPMLMG